MNNIDQATPKKRRSRFGSALLAGALVVHTMPAAALTDLSSTPLQGTSAAQAKPNIMLLMDASRSMGWGHMPDEVETITGFGSIGYKNAQCNVLYYNPTQTYVLPKLADGTFFPAPSFIDAPYAGFNDVKRGPAYTFYSAVDQADIADGGLNSTYVDLSAAFKAYDRKMLYQTFHNDTPQKAYYFKHSNPASLNYAAAPCTDADTTSANVGSTFAASTGGGTWTKVIVSANSGPGATDERTNFAIWYSFYRTRMSLTKSAASLAFTPLTDSFRVGFITVEPKDTPAAAAINPGRYVAISDFDITQRGLWFSKLFSQSPFGASPAREGLARVGRHYAGMQDGINTGMTGDPMQYSCQQNFTIMTTDGYWNAQSESTASGGFIGGPVDMTGKARVGQQDGNALPPGISCPVTNPYCPRPIFDGYAGVSRVDTDVATMYTDATCGLTLLFRTTYQNYETHHQVKKTTTVTTQDTDYYHETGAQDKAQTFQMTASRTRDWKVVTQLAEDYVQYIEDRYQVTKAQDQTTLHTEQWTQGKAQLTAQTKQTTKTVTQAKQSSRQQRQTLNQFQLATTQYATKREQYTQGKVQVIKHVYQTIATDSAQERQDALSGNCVQAGSVTCSTYEIFGPAPVDPSNCTQGVGPAPDYVKTDCTSGPLAAATAAIASCTTGTTNSGSPNYVVTTCTLSTVIAQAPLNGTCTVGAVTGGSPNYYVDTCVKPAGANNLTQFVASCTVGTTNSGSPNYVTSVCTKTKNNAQTFVQYGTCAASGPNSGNSYVDTACDTTSAANYAATPVAQPCANATGIAPSWIDKTCTVPNPATISTAIVAPASCTVGNTGSPSYLYTTCPSANVAPYAVATPVDTTVTCTAGAGTTVGPSPGFIVTTCANGPNYSAVAAVAPCTVGVTSATSGNSWTTTTCAKPTDITAYAPPCSNVAGTVSPFLKKTCTSATLLAATVVNPTTCTPFGTTSSGSPNYINTTCTKVPLAPLGGVCVVGNSGPPNWIQRDCNSATGTIPRAPGFCVPGAVRVVGNYTYTCVQPAANNTAGYAASCANSSPIAPNYITVSCSGPVVDSSVSGPVDPATCVNGTGGAPNYYTTTCSALTPAGTYPAPTGVPACSAATGPSPNFYVTQCTNPVATNFNRNVPVCTVQNVPKGSGNGYASYICTHTQTSMLAAGPAPANCSTQTSNSGTVPPYVAITCTTVPGSFTNTFVDPSTCVNDPNTTCVTTTETSQAFIDTCPASPSPSPNYFVYTCGSTTPSVPVADPTCMNSTGLGPNFVQTSCTNGPGTGHKEQQATTTTTTTSLLSGGALVAPPTVTTSTGPTTDVTPGACQANPVALPNPNPTKLPTVSVSTTLPDGSLDSLADVAQYYYKNDLRPLMINDVKSVGTAADVQSDTATHQHMTTFTLALGVSGTLNYQSNYRQGVVGDFDDIVCNSTLADGSLRNGRPCKPWPLWPDPAIDYTSTPAMAANWENKKSIDDFWHTAVNGRGLYFSATSPKTVVSGLSGALAGITATLASSTGQGVSSLQPTAGNNFIYTATYTTGKWIGDVVASTINLSNGTLNSPANWSASTLLNSRTLDQCDTRSIYLARAGATNGMVPFTWNTDSCVSGAPSGTLDTQLNATEKAFFGNSYVSLLSQWPQMGDGTNGTLDQKTAATGDTLVNYIRGQRGYEPFDDQLNTLYRKRFGLLGDIVDSQPVYVQAPFASYTDTGYSTFVTSNAGRTPMVYVGANDGMLHAFNAGTGQEAWAIIPSAVLPNLFKLADNNYGNVHQFYVDGQPTVGDVYDTTSSSWRTVLVNGLNDGGKAYFAVDITDPASPKTLWEFKWNPSVCPATPAGAVGNTQDCHVGYSYGKPIITKLANGTWVALVTSGYNNVNSPSAAGDGVGYLYVLDVMTGVIISKISTGAGSAVSPAGLAQINNFVDNAIVDNTTVRAYGGDLLGNIWRFDINGTPAVTLLGTATERITLNPQPITTRPELAEFNNKPLVLVGTGSLLGATDFANVQGQSIYGIVDPLTTAPVFPSPLRNSLRPLELVQSGTPPTATRTVRCRLTATPAECAASGGWVVDLPDAGERVNVDMKLVLGTLAVASNVPASNGSGSSACDSAGYSWINYLDFSTGLAVASAPGLVVSHYLTNSLVVGLNIIALPPAAGFNNPRFVSELQFGNGTGGQSGPPTGGPSPTGKRVSWREIAQ